jgi:HlyD family secretion protein
MQKKLTAALAVVVAVVLLAILAVSTHTRDPSVIFVSGNMEITEVDVSFKIAGRMVERYVDEGDTIKKDQLVALLELKDLELQAAERRADLQAAEDSLLELKNGYLPQEISQAAAKVDQTLADLNKQRADFARQKQLLERAVISQREFDTSRATFLASEAIYIEALEYYTLLKNGTRYEKIAQGEAKVKQAIEALGLAETMISYAYLHAPLNGWVLSKNVEPGEVVAAGTPVVTVGNLEDIWLRAYIDESDLGKINLSQEVTITTDTYPGKKYQGRITFISNEAEFTPKNVQTQKERVKLVYRIKVTVLNPNLELKPGMPADGLIHLKTG